ncbi:MAG TPA: SDR family oxidoreductase [Acidimicrobiales bacterium]|nr:SDR family oxidoreductase [Acidimicrobiales bacterium]
MRTVVVGASSGLGRCIGIGLAQRGAQVALLARRMELLADAAKEAGPGTLAVACDVTDPDSCRSAIEEAAGGLGGIDALVYSTAVGPLARLADVDAATWRHTFDTNVIGASLVTAAALPHLAEAHGAAAYLSSVSASMTPPWPGLGAYIVSKAALDKLVEAWRVEHPQVGFTRIIVGDCTGGDGPGMTQFANAWDPELAVQMGTEWAARALLAGSLLDVEDLVRAVDNVLRCGSGATIPSVAVVPRAPG